MAAQVLSFFQRAPRHAPAPADWTQQELAEFYRVESALIRAGIRVGTDRGLSDENEPWFVFYRSDDGEVVIHFARIDGEYIIAGPAYEEIARGFDFTALVRNMVARHPLIRRQENGNLSIHPAALLVAVVGTAFFKTGEARAAETGQSNTQSGHSRPVLLASSSNASLTGGVAAATAPAQIYDSVQIPANQAVLVLAAALLASDFSIDTVTVAPNTSAAMAAAAAALDFGGMPVSQISPVELAAPAATAHIVVDNTPVRTISSVLSLVAVLSTLPTASESLGAAESALAGALARGHDFSAAAAPSTTNENSWSIDVRLGFGSLPSVQSVQLVRGVFGEAGYQTVSVIELAQLPDVLANIIAHSSNHYSVPPANLTTSTPATPDVTTPTTTPTPPDATPPPPTPETPTAGSSVGHTDDGATSTPPTSGGVTDPVTTTPPTGGGEIIDTIKPTTPTTPTTPGIPLTTPSGYATQELVTFFVNYFVAHTAKIEVIVTGTSLVAFDARVLHDAGSIQDLDSVTFTFPDGHSVSLVGEHSAILDHSGLLH